MTLALALGALALLPTAAWAKPTKLEIHLKEYRLRVVQAEKPLAEYRFNAGAMRPGACEELGAWNCPDPAILKPLPLPGSYPLRGAVAAYQSKKFFFLKYRHMLYFGASGQIRAQHEGRFARN